MKERAAAVFLGSILLSLGVNGFLVPWHLLDGGVIGLGLIIHYFYGLPTGLSIILLSMPLYLLAWKFERRYFYYSLLGLIISSLSIDFFSFLNESFHLAILPSTIIGGLLVGMGIGLMLRYEMSTGGTDLLAQLLTKITPLNVGVIIFLIDSLVITSGIPVVGLEKYFYSFLTILCVGTMTTLFSAKNRELY